MSFWKRYGILIGLIAIVVVGALIRLYRIGDVPYGYTYDETGITYDAWSISLWHRDQFASFMPLSFQSFGDYKPPLLIYLLATIDVVFGLHEVSIRLVSAFAGIGSILVTYCLAKALFDRYSIKKSRFIGLLAAIVIAFSPWSIQLSRIGFEQNLTFFLGLTGIWLLIEGLNRPKLWIVSGVVMASSIYAFHTAKIFVPLSLLSFVIFFGHEISRVKKWFWLGLLTLFVCLIPFIYTSVNQQVNTRANTLIIYGGTDKIQSLDKIGTEFLNNIVNQLSPAFWIFGWDATSIRHAVPGFGVLLIPIYVIFMAALIWTIARGKNQVSGFLLCLWLAGLIPAIISHTTPHVIRSQFTLIATALIAADGFAHFFSWLKKKQGKATMIIVVSLITLLVLIQLSFYISTYFGSYAEASASEFQYGYRQAIESINTHERNDETIIVTTRYQQPYIYLLLYNRITPQDFLFGGLNQYKIMPIKWGSDPEKGLYLATPEEIPVYDPRVIQVISVPHSQQPVLVIARNP